jgi:nucleoid DNA-binding protein
LNTTETVVHTSVPTSIRNRSVTFKAGDKVSRSCFDAQSSSLRATRTGRNPRTGAPVKVAACGVASRAAPAKAAEIFKATNVAENP